MKIIAIADTHGQHHNLKIQKGDILIHAGDVTQYGNEDELYDFLEWFGCQKPTFKVWIGGEHDWCLESTKLSRITDVRKKGIGTMVCLQNSSITINGFKIYGSPVTPYFRGMALNRERGKEIKVMWQKIPSDTDILITHGPPFGILDKGVGCEELLAKVIKVKPRLHIFGHVHQGFGV
ncbi:MAG: metallophosphatase domain-containing protein [Cytophagales bacterium]